MFFSSWFLTTKNNVYVSSRQKDSRTCSHMYDSSPLITITRGVQLKRSTAKILYEYIRENERELCQAVCIIDPRSEENLGRSVLPVGFGTMKRKSTERQSVVLLHVRDERHNWPLNCERSIGLVQADINAAGTKFTLRRGKRVQGKGSALWSAAERAYILLKDLRSPNPIPVQLLEEDIRTVFFSERVWVVHILLPFWTWR